MRKIVVSVVAVLLIGSYSCFVNAQGDISNIFKAGLVDLNKVAEGYLKPAGSSFSAGLGTNWYNTAAVHKAWGFDLTIGAGVVQAPLEDQSFSLTGLTNLRPTVAGTTSAPTFMGSGKGVELNLNQPQYLSNGQANPLYPGVIAKFSTPDAVFKYVPTASIQFTIGIPFINDVSVRYSPKVSVKGFEASMWGIGIKHNFKQWIPVIKDLPFDAAVVLAYSKFDVKYAFPAASQITPDKLVSDGVTYDDGSTSLSYYATQGMKVSATAQTANLVFSKKLAFITPYVGFGITKTNFDLSMDGNYPILGDPQTITVGGVIVPKLNGNGKPIMQIDHKTNPINFNSPETMTNATLGLRLKLAIFTLHAQYAFQKYPVASAGFGISIR
ncbi:MAG: hypothetical protein PHT07_20565 [Paludibacter sp.]|nr:hypothetical protein [Paludibacter sp.]